MFLTGVDDEEPWHSRSDRRAVAELEPLIDAVRPPCKVPHDNLRETIEAILWRHQNGAKWRSIPGELEIGRAHV